MDYVRAMTALRRRRWLITAAVLGCTVATAAGTRVMKREFLASATVMPQEQALESFREMSTPADVAQERDDLLGRQDRLKTIATILASPAVLGDVIQKLHLRTTPSLLGEQIDVKELTSQVLRVSVKDEDPKRASAIVNAVVDRFTNYYGEIRSREAKKQLALLEKERGNAEASLQEAGSRLESFKRRGNISSLPDQMKEALERSGQLEQERNTAEARLREITAQLATVQEQLATTPATREIKESASQTALLDKLRVDVSDLKAALTKELGVHTEEHPSVQRLQQQLKEAEQRLETESTRMNTTTRVVANPEREALQTQARMLRNERDGLQARVGSLGVKLASFQARSNGYSGKDVELALLSQRYQLAEQRLTGVMGRLGHVRNAAGLLGSGSPIAVVDRSGPANPPFDLSQGRTLKLTALAFVMSLALCVALTLALEMADRRVKSVEDVQDLTQLPVVSVVPRLSPGRGGAGALCLTTETDPASHLAEAYHFLANHVLRQTWRRETTVLMGVTGRPGQGATTALSNLAVALAKAGRQVVLVEADLRRPFLHDVFSVGSKPGLTDVLGDHIDVAAALAPTSVENLRLLAGGSTVKDPWSLLWSPRMSEVIEQLRSVADYVIFNVPSATVFADALCVAPHVDGAVLVMRTSEMPNGAEQQVRSWLEEVNVPVMGVVLNGMPTRDMESYDFHRTYTSRRADQTSPALVAPSLPQIREAA